MSISLQRPGAPFDRGQKSINPNGNPSHMNATAKTTRTLARSTAAAIVSTIAAGVLLTGAGSAQASGTVTTVEGYRVTLGPLQSDGLPTMKCPAGSYLHNYHYSPGRLVPNGVQVLEPGGVGVSMGGATLATTQPTGLPLGVQVYDSTAGPASATNWALTSQELVINLVCTTNPWDAAYYDPYHVRG